MAITTRTLSEEIAKVSTPENQAKIAAFMAKHQHQPVFQELVEILTNASNVIGEFIVKHPVGAKEPII